MNYILALLAFSQFCFIFAQVNTNHRSAVRSFVFEEAHHPTVIEKRQGNGQDLSEQDRAMTCRVSDKYPKQTGKARNCFQAIAQLYIIQPSPPCAICDTCAVMPITREMDPLAGINGLPPTYPQDDMNAAYNNMFSNSVLVSTGKKQCPKYELPTGVTIGNLPGPMFANYLLGMNDDQGVGCKACSSDLTEDVRVNGG
ncbi:uncharacterized protein MELLADRAFT_104000 [Melampsora larici-populina 98AG31]|uniref:Secreted protein n=1 Tax=Melampsora larici-populina (strain 98AG31 / pathotype 3-4-7) TaxID=747676 RepID=F4RD83_MELLP|nr:uncharacterized protein MELLADRAFT_104000 [Melampsora larici-populina 98AG31]EGG09356.1 secreted protein [Melampsora larici-populina 98AG31]